MANFYARASVVWRAQGPPSLAFATDDKRTAVLIARFALSPISRVTGAFQTLRQRERDRGELARMSRYELHDIRLSSSDRWAEISKPFWRT
jgi:uncharacterized protein YjiS (DUF1127 family)